MRTATPITELYHWHTEALAGRRPQITGEPHCGWFKCKLVRGGPYVAARIYMDREVDHDTGELLSDEKMRCEIDGRERDPEEQWTYICYIPITEAEYKFLIANAEWAKKYALNEPAANPERAVDFNKLPLDF